MKRRHVSPHQISDAADQFDPTRTDIENRTKMLDHLGQFTGRMSQKQVRDLEFELDEQIAIRRKANNPFGFDF